MQINYSHFFSKNISVYAMFNDQNFNNTLTNNIVSFEQLGPDCTNGLVDLYLPWAHMFKGKFSVVAAQFILMKIPTCCHCECGLILVPNEIHVDRFLHTFSSVILMGIFCSWL